MTDPYWAFETDADGRLAVYFAEVVGWQRGGFVALSFRELCDAVEEARPAATVREGSEEWATRTVVAWRVFVEIPAEEDRWEDYGEEAHQILEIATSLGEKDREMLDYYAGGC